MFELGKENQKTVIKETISHEVAHFDTNLKGLKRIVNGNNAKQKKNSIWVLKKGFITKFCQKDTKFNHRKPHHLEKMDVFLILPPKSANWRKL